MGNNPMKAQALSIPQLFEDVFWRLEADARLVIPTPNILNMRNIFITGCGDSYMAGKAAEHSFLQLAGINTRANLALDLSRYYAQLGLPAPEKDNLVIGISSSGEAARVVEAQQRCSNANCYTLALTSNATSRLGKASHKVLDCTIPSMESSPGVRSYIVSLLALQLLAIRFGEVKANYTMDKAGDLRKELFGLKDVIATSLEEAEPKLKDFVGAVNKNQRVEILGAGSMRAVADFAAASVIEAVGYHAVSQDVEEFGHVNFFKLDPESYPTILIAPEDANARSRILEIADSIATLQRPYIIICNGKAEGFEKHSEHLIVIKGEFEEMFAPVVYSSVVALFASLLGDQEKPSYFRNGAGVYDESKVVRPNESKIEI